MRHRYLFTTLAALIPIGGASALALGHIGIAPGVLASRAGEERIPETVQGIGLFPAGWSSPSVSSTHGVQFRRRFELRGPLDRTPDVIYRFEALPTSTVATLHAQYPSIAITPQEITAAAVVRDVKEVAGEQVLFVGQQLADGAWEVRIPAPPGGWLHQTINLHVLAWNGPAPIVDSESQLMLIEE